ncbi:MAG: hypothetical protein P8Y94_02825, partial [Acidobacteriota bacterium]
SYTSRTREGQTDYSVQMVPAYRKQLGQTTVRQAREIITRRIDQYGVAEPSITVYGSGEVPNQIIVELPGVQDFERVKDLIKSTARLELKLAYPDPAKRGPFSSKEAALAAFNNKMPEGYAIYPYQDRNATSGQQQ